ncbi:hypothetical protein C1878_15835 [Gordonibacter sp. 28C]|nr:hypothetical protein C1878_15835 [Gordonibacter sp. 28C]
MFLILFAAMSFSFLIAGKGFIWNVDGLEQQYVFFAYEGEWLRELLYNLFIARTGDIPSWSMEIGYGADVALTLLPSLGDPLNLLSVLVPLRYADLALNVSVPLHLFLAGLAFSGFCLYRGKDRFSVLVASMVYVFSGYTLLAFSQIFMLYPLLLGPLVVWGIEKILSHESPLLFIVALALCFLKSVTMVYAVCILLVVYCAIRYAFLPEKKSFGGFLKWLFTITGYVLIAGLIGAILFIPGVVTLLGEGRIGLDRPESLLYSITYYVKLVLGFGSVADVGADCSYGFAAIALLAVFLLFGKNAGKGIASSPNRTECKVLRILFVVMTIFLCLPIVGKVFNGFAYPNNRWVWAYVLCIAYIVAAMLPDCLSMKRGCGKTAVKGSIVYAFVVVFVLFPFKTNEALFGVAVLFVLLTVLAGGLELSMASKKVAVLVSLLVCVGFLFNNFGSQFGASGGRVANQVGMGRSYDVLVENNPTTLVSQVNDSSFWRYDSAGTGQYLNGNIVQGLKSPLFYDSYYNDLVDEYHTGLGLASSSINFMYSGLDSRTPLEALAGVKYFVTPSDSTSLVPPLFNSVALEGEAEGESYQVSETDSNLPLVFMYDETVPREKYDAMDPAQKQQALLQGVVLEDSLSLEESPVSFNDERLDFVVEYLDGTTVEVGDAKEDSGFSFDGSSFTVYRGDARVVLDVLIPANVDAYVGISGFTYYDILPSERLSESDRDNVQLFQKQQLAFQDAVYGVGTVDSKIRLRLGEVEKTLWNPTSGSHLFGGKDEWLVNMGYSDAERQRIELVFQDPGVYSFDKLEVIAQPVGGFVSQLQKLKMTSDKINDVRYTGSTLSCEASVEGGSKLVYFMIPFSQGWSAEVDGVSVDLLKANVAFMGLELDEGVHEIKLHYVTPGLKLGAALSLGGFVLLAALLLARRKTHRANDRKDRGDHAAIDGRMRS